MAKNDGSPSGTNVDALDEALTQLRGASPQGRPNLAEFEKDDLVRRVGGPRTTRSILKAAKELPAKRLLHLFSSLDSQLVADILVNDMKGALERATTK